MAEGKKRGRSRGLRILLIVLALWGIGIGVAVMVVSMTPRIPELIGSPADSRDHPIFRSESPVGLLEKDEISEPAHSAQAPYGRPVRVDGIKNDFVLHWQDEGERQENSAPVPRREANGLQGDDSLELFAFATWTPAADDDLSTEGRLQAALTFRDPKTLEVIPEQKLDTLQLPASFRSAATPKRYKTGLIRLLFRSSTMNPVRFIGGSGGDAVTGAKVTYDLSELEDNEPNQASSGEWAWYDFAFLLWHDKPLTFHLQVLTGEPEFAELAQSPGEQVAFGDRLRLQWLKRLEGRFDSRLNDSFTPKSDTDLDLLAEIARPDPPNSGFGPTSPGMPPNAYQIESDIAAHFASQSNDDGSTKPETVFRISDDSYVEHLGRITDDGSILWDFSEESDHGNLQFVSCEHTATPNEPLHLIFLPQITALTFEIAGTPDLPNPRNIENLFDQKIPRLTLSGDGAGEAETELISFIAVATQSGKEHDKVWSDQWPRSMPADHTFRDTTPRQLIEWYLHTSSDAFVTQDAGSHLLTVNYEEENFWDKVMELISQW